MPIAEVILDKKILLHAPDDLSELIRCARYIPLVAEYASGVSLILSDTNGIADLIQSAFPDISVVFSNTSRTFHPDVELDLVELPAMFINDSHPVNTRYLHAPPDTLAGFKNIMGNTGMLNIGLALYGSPDSTSIDSLMISNNITMKLLHETQFFFIPADPNQSESKPPYSNFQDTAKMIHNYCELAALLTSLDIIISFDNDVAHLAAALGKPVWLLTPYSANTNKLDFWALFSNVTIFGQPPSGSWKEVIQAIALFRFLQPESSSFIPFSTDHKMLNQSAAIPFPMIHFENTSQLTQILDAELATFTSVSIETTTVCNLTCSYCPHSTDEAKPPAFMPDEMFFRIIDSLHEYAPSYRGSIAPSMYGEPLLDKRIETFIQYAKNKFPLATIELFTNGDFLTPERFFSLRDAGVGHFNISQHTPARSQALSDTLAIVQWEFGGDVPITINKMLEQNKFNRGGLVDVEGYSPEICARMSHCIAAYQNLSFDYKGDALLCCNDYQAKHTFGNIASKSIRDIWNGSNYRRIRNMSMLGFLPFPICRVCLNH